MAPQRQPPVRVVGGCDGVEGGGMVGEVIWMGFVYNILDKLVFFLE